MKPNVRVFYLQGVIALISVFLQDQNISAHGISPVSPSLAEYASTQIDTAKLNISTESVTLFSTQGSKAYVTITTSGFWYLKCSEKWLSANVLSGTGVRKIEIKADENIGTGARSAYVTIYVKGLHPLIIDVLQKARHEE
jgi:hypothetical protein